MTRPSTIDELPEEIRVEIGRLRTQGCTLDRILEHLRSLHGVAPSRSALGRHVQKLDAVGEKLRRSRTVAEALVRELGDEPASKTTRLNIELLHGTIFDLFNQEDGAAGLDEGGRAALAGNPEGIMMLARSLESLTRASKTDVEHIAQVEERAAEKARKAAAAAVEAVGKSEGITAATAAKIKAAIFGVRA